ncbi:MAG: dihydroorotate dehydrogenase electron transfer subunit [Firmicutes bacterium]|nr:dihydroorotate dehydrogenase electron transfer subunit [Bacillota bacterium]MCL5039290.1 dihydroorotate dehydrogenase electron transfer subunit [Bacillota bacterium]
MTMDLLARIERREEWGRVASEKAQAAGDGFLWRTADKSQGGRGLPAREATTPRPVPGRDEHRDGVLYVRLTLRAGELAQQAEPGQFVMVKADDGLDPFLRRPLSFHRINQERGEVQILFQVKGRGTGLLARRLPGDALQLLGPLGRGFTLEQRMFPENGAGTQRQRVVLVGGGIGVAPLLALAEKAARGGDEVLLLLGARSRDDLLAVSDFRALGAQVHLATDDGSLGHHGLITDLLDQVLREDAADAIYACGPLPMLKKVAQLADQFGRPAQLSLEERMGCGLGACIGCVVGTKGPGGQPTYKKVCQDGPVFPAQEVILP